jgi:multiple sugar transport system substrate-binding protein
MFASLALRRVSALLLIASFVLAACDMGNPTPVPPTATTAPAAATNTTAPAADATATTAPAVAATNTTAPAAAATNTTAPAMGNGPTLNTDVSGTVEFWHFWGSPVRRAAIRRVVAECAVQLPNIKVNETFKPFGDIWTANTAAVAAGSGMPDVIVEDRPKLPQAAANNIETNLQEWATRDNVVRDQFWPFTWDQTLYEGNTYGIPFETDVRVLYWNKDVFSEVGLDPEKPPVTWDDAWAYADKLDKKNDDGTYARIGFFPLINIGVDVWAYTNGAEWVTADGQVMVNDPKVVEVLEWVKRWVDRYGGWSEYQKFRGQFSSPPNDAFMSGKVAMVADINGYLSQLNFYRPRYTAPDGTGRNMVWGIGDIPYKTEKASWSGGFAFSIPRGARNAEAAWEFIKCATGVKGAESWSRDTYAMSANLEASKSPILMADQDWQFMINAMEYSTGGTYLEAYPNYFEQVNNRLEEVWQGAKEPKAALDEAQAAIEAEVNK